MKKIQMVDLQSQYEKIKSDVDRGIQEVIDSAQFIKGTVVSEFQHDLEIYTGSKHVIPVGNGTDGSNCVDNFFSSIYHDTAWIKYRSFCYLVLRCRIIFANQ